MAGWEVAALTLLGVLVGALVPAILQLTLTLRSLRAAADRAGPALVAITSAAERLDRLTARLEAGGRIEQLMESVETLARTAGKLQDGARIAAAVGAAVGPAVGAAVRAWRTPRPDEPPGPDGTEAAAPAGEGRADST